MNAFMNAGAVGARLTGAGWGGCVVAVCESSCAENILAEVKKTFYEKRFQSGVANKADEASLLFKTAPSAGAAILHYDDEKGVVV